MPDTDAAVLEGVLEGQRGNAVLAWLLTGFVAVVALEGLLDADFLWMAFSLAVVALALVPPLTYRDPMTMLPWEVLALCSLPILGRALATNVLANDLATYLSVAALALVVAVELDVFTQVTMPPWFAVVFVSIATLAAAGVWAVVQWVSDLTLGTTFIYPEPVSRPAYVRDGGFVDAMNWLLEVFLDGGESIVSASVDHAAHDALMWDFVAAFAAGLLAGVVFELYFRRRARGRARLPENVQEVVDDARA